MWQLWDVSSRSALVYLMIMFDSHPGHYLATFPMCDGNMAWRDKFSFSHFLKRLTIVCNPHFRKGGFEKIWKRVKGWVYRFYCLKGCLCIKGVSKITRVGSDIVHQCKDYYFILRKIMFLNNFNHVEFLQIHTSLMLVQFLYGIFFSSLIRRIVTFSVLIL